MSTGLRITRVVLLLIGVMTLYGCGSADNTDNNNNNMAEQNLSSTNNISNQEDNIRKNEYSGDNMQSDKDSNNKYTKDTRVIDVINDEAFGNYGRLIFPVDMRISNDLTLENISSILPWYSEINTDKTVEIVNYLRNEAESGRQIFYDIYSDSEKADDPEKQNTGIFFFKGNDNAKSAVVNAGGGFVYVAGIHDSFPHALELSKKGYNAFAFHSEEAASIAILKSLPGSYPAFLTASRIVSIASSSDFNAGAKPPSSPTEVASPRSFNIEASAWNTSEHHLKHSLNEGAPTGIIINS